MKIDVQRPKAAFVRGANLDTSMMSMGSIMSFLVRAEDCGGRFSMVEYRSRPGNEPPAHLHLWEHEMFTFSKARWNSISRTRSSWSAVHSG